MHVMSQRNTLVKIMKDTVREWYRERLEMIQSWLQKEHFSAERLLRKDNFEIAPPYFALHLLNCLGPSASWDERATFVTFLTSFLKTSLFSTEYDVYERGKLIHQLAKSNRVLFLEAINDSNGLASKIRLGRGFISLYRSKQDAIHDFHEGESFGEDFELISFEDVSMSLTLFTRYRTSQRDPNLTFLSLHHCRPSKWNLASTIYLFMKKCSPCIEKPTILPIARYSSKISPTKLLKSTVLSIELVPKG